MKFRKYVAAGNDFLAFRGEDLVGVDYSQLAARACHRQFGLGADGILVAEKSDQASIKMVYYNSDGSQGEMCGNGIRSFVKFVYDLGLVDLGESKLGVETLDGIKDVRLEVDQDQLVAMEVKMGRPSFRKEEVPVLSKGEEVLQEPLYLGGETYSISCLRMGVPHGVIFMDRVDPARVNELGSRIELLDMFPEKINVNFVEVVSAREINIFTWERGAGRTLGCGTGSCASVVVGQRLGLLEDQVRVNTEGGSLSVRLDSGQVYMSGGASFIAQGDYNYI